MTLGWQIARGAMVLVILGAVVANLPVATVYDASPLTVPDVIWNPLVGVLSLNRYLPITTLLVLAAFTIAIQAGMAGFWMVSWVLRHVLG